MEKETDSIYLNFPVQLLKGFLKGKENSLMNIVYYSLIDERQKFRKDNKNASYRILESWGIQEYDTRKKRFLSVNPDEAEKKGELLHHQLDDSSPKTGIKLEELKEFLYQEKDELECVCLLFLLATRSLLIGKPYFKTTKMFLLSRMDGEIKAIKDPKINKKEETEENKENKTLSPEIYKYYGRYQFDRIRQAMLNWNVFTYSLGYRGFYITTKLSLTELAYQVEKIRIDKEPDSSPSLHILTKQAREEALSRLKNEKILN